MDIDNEDIQCGPFDIFYCGLCTMYMLTVNYKHKAKLGDFISICCIYDFPLC